MRRVSEAQLAAAAICAAFVVVGQAEPVRADTGDVLVAYLSSLGTTPEFQGWEHEGRCLGVQGVEPPERCPHETDDPDCWFQGSRDFTGEGAPDNSCLPGVGCRKDHEHYNSPTALTEPDRCMYTEWIAFDDGDNYGVRPLTISDSTVTGSPPWGAPQFENAPAHSPLRISTGDGNLVPDSLPVTGPDPWKNDRNEGKVKIRRGDGHGSSYTVAPGTVTTVLCSVAAGPRRADHPFLLVRQCGYEFRFGIDGDAGSPDFGRIVYQNAGGSRVPLFGGRTVAVAVPGAPGPHAGEFFLFRAVIHPDGTFDAWLNDRLDSFCSGSHANTHPAAEIQITPDVGDDTLWVDYVQLLEGEVPPSCPDPRPDVNRDGRVDGLDWNNAEGIGFNNCATGPAPSDLVWNALAADCHCLDIDGNEAIDMTDYAVFQRCLTPTGPADPDCDN